MKQEQRAERVRYSYLKGRLISLEIETFILFIQ